MRGSGKRVERATVSRSALASCQDRGEEIGEAPLSQKTFPVSPVFPVNHALAIAQLGEMAAHREDREDREGGNGAGTPFGPAVSEAVTFGQGMRQQPQIFVSSCSSW